MVLFQVLLSSPSGADVLGYVEASDMNEALTHADQQFKEHVQENTMIVLSLMGMGKRGLPEPPPPPKPLSVWERLRKWEV